MEAPHSLAKGIFEASLPQFQYLVQSELPVYNGLLLVEATISLVSEPPVDNECEGWAELMTKLLQAERALRFFEARHGATAVKYLFFDSPAFEKISKDTPLDEQPFWKFFSWLFEQTIPTPVSLNEPNSQTTKSNNELEEDEGDDELYGEEDDDDDVLFVRSPRNYTTELRKMLEVRDAVTDIQMCPSIYQLADTKFPWDQPQVSLARAFNVELHGTLLRVGQIFKASVPAWNNPQQQISPPCSPKHKGRLSNAAENRGEQKESERKSQVEQVEQVTSLTPEGDDQPEQQSDKETNKALTFGQCLPKLCQFFEEKKFIPRTMMAHSSK